MYFITGTRARLGRALPKLKRVCELGVFKGDNAQFLLEHHNPVELCLVDAWSASSLLKSYYLLDTKLPFVDPIESYASYFGGNPAEQQTWENNFEHVKNRFHKFPQVKIFRTETHMAAEKFQNNYFDLIYVDAGHQYPFVQRDLFVWKDKLKPDGFFILNDCASTHEGRAQNLGVLEAVTNFVKSTEFRPVALTCDIWADLILSRDLKSENVQFLKRSLLADSSISVIELPEEALFSFNHKKVECAVEGRAQILNVPSFKLT